MTLSNKRTQLPDKKRFFINKKNGLNNIRPMKFVKKEYDTYSANSAISTMKSGMNHKAVLTLIGRTYTVTLGGQTTTILDPHFITSSTYMHMKVYVFIDSIASLTFIDAVCMTMFFAIDEIILLSKFYINTNLLCTFVKSRSHEIGNFNNNIALKFAMLLRGSATEVLFNFPSCRTIPDTNSAVLRLGIS